jgi:serine/threonine-protein kinase
LSAATNATADRTLLFGIIAVQMGFISREALVAAMIAWAQEKTKPLGEILALQNALTREDYALLESLVDEHLNQNGNDLKHSLAAIASPQSVKADLAQMDDADVQASIAQVQAEINEGEGKALLQRTMPISMLRAAVATRFRFLRPWREGGLGKVSIARDEELRREVALKEIKPQHANNKASRERFILEAEITASLEHPGIVPVYGLGKYGDGRPYYAMRFVRGESLEEAIDRYHCKGLAAGDNERVADMQDKADTKALRRITLDRQTSAPAQQIYRKRQSSVKHLMAGHCVASFNEDRSRRAVEFRELLGRFIAVCNTVAYAHSRGVLHRDLKPANIILGKYGETLIIDWGLAKVLGEDEVPESSRLDESLFHPGGGAAPTKIGTLVGTPQYMSPEQASGRLELLSAASDVYSLGATLYCLLTGQAPCTDEKTSEVVRKVQQGEIAQPRQVNKNISPALEAICLKAMATNPMERYRRPKLLANDLENWLADEPVSAYSEPLVERAIRWGRRHLLIVSVAIAVLTITVIALAVRASRY